MAREHLQDADSERDSKPRLVALWPVPYATNADFRKNFQQALKS